MTTKVTTTQFRMPKQLRPILRQIPTATMHHTISSSEFLDNFRLGSVYGEYDYSDDPALAEFRDLFGKGPTKFIAFVTRSIGDLGVQFNIDFRVNDETATLSNTSRFYCVTKGQATIFDYIGERHVIHAGEMLYLPTVRSQYVVAVTVRPNTGKFARLDRDTQIVCFSASMVVPKSVLSLIGSEVAESLIENDRDDLERVDKINEKALNDKLKSKQKHK